MFKNREEAGKLLADKLGAEMPPEAIEEIFLLAIPRGGVVVGGEISKILKFPIDLLITKKIPAPESEELAIGAVGEGGVVIWEEGLCRRLNVPIEYKQEIVKKKVEELEKKKSDFRGDRPPPELRDKRVIIVDDGVATGATIKAAVAVARSFAPKEIVVAVPVIAKDALLELKKTVDKIVYLEAPEMFFSVGQFYKNFEQISDEEARRIL